MLLNNGNLLEHRTLPDGRAQAIWEDPFPKPCYLFALVAGRPHLAETRVNTASGRDVLLRVYSDPGSESKRNGRWNPLVRFAALG